MSLVCVCACVCVCASVCVRACEQPNQSNGKKVIRSQRFQHRNVFEFWAPNPTLIGMELTEEAELGLNFADFESTQFHIFCTTIKEKLTTMTIVSVNIIRELM